MRLNFALLALLLAAPGFAQTSFMLAPQPGTSRTKTIERHEQFALDELEVFIDGKDMAKAFHSLDFYVDNHLQLEVRDTYQEVAGGKLQVLERRFERLELGSKHTLSSASLAPGVEALTPGTSPLEKRTVTFRRGGDGQLVVKASDGSAMLDPHWSGGLRAELDATAFLPIVPVEPNARWKVDPALAGAIFAPCGDLHFRTPKGAAGSPGAAASLAPLGSLDVDSFEGLIEARFEGVSQRLGQRVARIHLELKIRAKRDLSARAVDFVPRFPAPVRFEPGRLEASSFFEGTGLLQWNLDTQVLESLELTGEGGVTILQTGQLETGALVQELRQKLGLVGPQSLSITCRD